MSSPREAWRQARAHITETEQALQERAWDLKERESTLEAKKQRLNATCAEIQAGQQRKATHECQCNTYRRQILEVQKALKEEERQRTDLLQMQKDTAKSLEEKTQGIASQQAAFEQELESFEEYTKTISAFLQASHDNVRVKAEVKESLV